MNNTETEPKNGVARGQLHTFVLFLICFLLSGCGQAQGFSEDQKTTRQKAVDACVSAGGVPIIGYWTGYVKECQFCKEIKE